MRLREIVDNATPGPWEYSERDSGYNTVRAWPQLVVCDAMDNGDADATFIATFDPVLVRALLDVAEAAVDVVSPDYRTDPGPYAPGVRIDSMNDLMDALDRLHAIAGEAA